MDAEAIREHTKIQERGLSKLGVKNFNLSIGAFWATSAVCTAVAYLANDKLFGAKHLRRTNIGAQENMC